jgi:hypothetical protein
MLMHLEEFHFPSIMSQLMEYSKDLELYAFGADLDSLWSYLLCTRSAQVRVNQQLV